MLNTDDTGHSSDESFALPALSSYALELLSADIESNAPLTTDGVEKHARDAVSSLDQHFYAAPDRRSSGPDTQALDTRDNAYTRHRISSSSQELARTPYQEATPGLATPAFTRGSTQLGHTVEPTSQYRSIFRKSKPGRLGPPKRAVRRQSQESEENLEGNSQLGKSPNASPRERRSRESSEDRDHLIGEHVFEGHHLRGANSDKKLNSLPEAIDNRASEGIREPVTKPTAAKLRFSEQDEEIPQAARWLSDASTHNSSNSKEASGRQMTYFSSDHADIDTSRSSYVNMDQLTGSLHPEKKVDVFRDPEPLEPIPVEPQSVISPIQVLSDRKARGQEHNLLQSNLENTPQSRGFLSSKAIDANKVSMTGKYAKEIDRNLDQIKSESKQRLQGRQLLTPLSSNIIRPLRTSTPPPECDVLEPPPKMSNLDIPRPTPRAAAKKYKNTVMVAGKNYQRLELLGKGGSSKVFKVQLLNSTKVYAMKKVTFDEVDDAVVRGFKGEIELLRKLSNEDRVVKLVDFEISEGCVNMVMECGEIDLAHVLSARLNSPIDMAFIRFHTAEMLACVEAVHRHGIVHSDLKPANFLFVRGILKIIDFGIANAVPEYTMNVRRDTQMGTPNYMAPETFMDISQLDPNTPAGKKCVKVGRPSDVWSCGCIIYQMIYGRPPYAAYTGTQRFLAIMNPKVQVSYPETGLGGVRVPREAINAIKGCLHHDPDQRSTIADIKEGEFLQPRYISKDILLELLTQSVKYGAEGGAVAAADVGLLTEDVWRKIGLLNRGT